MIALMEQQMYAAAILKAVILKTVLAISSDFIHNFSPCRASPKTLTWETGQRTSLAIGNFLILLVDNFVFWSIYLSIYMDLCWANVKIDLLSFGPYT